MSEIPVLNTDEIRDDKTLKEALDDIEKIIQEIEDWFLVCGNFREYDSLSNLINEILCNGNDEVGCIFHYEIAPLLTLVRRRIRESSKILDKEIKGDKNE